MSDFIIIKQITIQNNEVLLTTTSYGDVKSTVRLNILTGRFPVTDINNLGFNLFIDKLSYSNFVRDINNKSVSVNVSALITISTPTIYIDRFEPTIRFEIPIIIEGFNRFNKLNYTITQSSTKFSLYIRIDIDGISIKWPGTYQGNVNFKLQVIGNSEDVTVNIISTPQIIYFVKLSDIIEEAINNTLSKPNMIRC